MNPLEQQQQEPNNVITQQNPIINTAEEALKQFKPDTVLYPVGSTAEPTSTGITDQLPQSTQSSEPAQPEQLPQGAQPTLLDTQPVPPALSAPIIQEPVDANLPQLPTTFSGTSPGEYKDSATEQLGRIKLNLDILGSNPPSAPSASYRPDPVLQDNLVKTWFHYLTNPIGDHKANEGYLEIAPNFYLKNVGTLGGAFDFLFTPFRAGYGLLADTQYWYYLTRNYLGSKTPGGRYINNLLSTMDAVRTGEIKTNPLVQAAAYALYAPLEFPLEATFGTAGLDQALYKFSQPNLLPNNRNDGSFSGWFVNALPNLTASVLGAEMSAFSTSGQTREGSDRTFSLSSSAEFTNPYSGTIFGSYNPFTHEKWFDIEKFANTERTLNPLEVAGAAVGWTALFISDAANPVNLLTDHGISKIWGYSSLPQIAKHASDNLPQWTKVPISQLLRNTPSQAVTETAARLNRSVDQLDLLAQQLRASGMPESEIANVVERTKAGLRARTATGDVRTFSSPEQAAEAIRVRLIARGYSEQEASDVATRIVLSHDSPNWKETRQAELAHLYDTLGELVTPGEARAVVQKALDTALILDGAKTPTISDIQNTPGVVWDSDLGAARPANVHELTIQDLKELKGRGFYWDGDKQALVHQSSEALTIGQFKALQEELGVHWDGDLNGFVKNIDTPDNVYIPDSPERTQAEQLLSEYNTYTEREALREQYAQIQQSKPKLSKEQAFAEARALLEDYAQYEASLPAETTVTYEQAAQARFSEGADLPKEVSNVVPTPKPTPTEPVSAPTRLESTRSATEALSSGKPSARLVDALGRLMTKTEPTPQDLIKRLEAQDSIYLSQLLGIERNVLDLPAFYKAVLEHPEGVNAIKQAVAWGDARRAAATHYQPPAAGDIRPRRATTEERAARPTPTRLDNTPPAPVNADLEARPVDVYRPGSAARKPAPTPEPIPESTPKPRQVLEIQTPLDRATARPAEPGTATTPTVSTTPEPAPAVIATESTPASAVNAEPAPVPTASAAVERIVPKEGQTYLQALEELKYSELRAYAKKLGIKANGSQEVIRERLVREAQGTATAADRPKPKPEYTNKPSKEAKAEPVSVEKLISELYGKLGGINKALKNSSIPPETAVRLQARQQEILEQINQLKATRDAEKIAKAEAALDAASETRRKLDNGEWEPDVYTKARSDARRLGVQDSGNIAAVAKRIEQEVARRRAEIPDLTVSDLRDELKELGISNKVLQPVVDGKRKWLNKEQLIDLLKVTYDSMLYDFTQPVPASVPDNPTAIAAQAYNDAITSGADDSIVAEAASALNDQLIHENTKEVVAAIEDFAQTRTEFYQQAASAASEARTSAKRVKQEIDTAVHNEVEKAAKFDTPTTPTESEPVVIPRTSGVTRSYSPDKRLSTIQSRLYKLIDQHTPGASPEKLKFLDTIERLTSGYSTFVSKYAKLAETSIKTGDINNKKLLAVFKQYEGGSVTIPEVSSIAIPEASIEAAKVAINKLGGLDVPVYALQQELGLDDVQFNKLVNKLIDEADFDIDGDTISFIGDTLDTVIPEPVIKPPPNRNTPEFAQAAKEASLSQIAELAPLDQLYYAEKVIGNKPIDVHELYSMVSMSKKDFRKNIFDLHYEGYLELLTESPDNLTPTEISDSILDLCGLIVTGVRFF